ncbi:MAG: molybdenum cofactor guanylyltransferase [Bryobacteraceae bacterium]
MQASGFVLAGGNSSRMGRNKAYLPGVFRYILDDVAENVRAVTGNVMLVGDPSRYHEFDYPCVSDLRPGMGPLAGLESALIHSSNDLSLVVACDMPAIPSAVFQTLLERIRNSNASCVVAQDALGRIHPLCAVYKRTCLPAIQCRLDEKRLSLMGLLAELSTDYVRVSGVIENINTPEEWTRWTSRDANTHESWQTLT